MTASTIRFVLIAALVVGGVLVINQAFPDSVSSAGSGQVPDGNGGPVQTAPTAPTGPTGETAPPTDATIPSPTITGTTIAVFNTTDVTGLAGELNDQLVADGYVEGQQPADAEFSQETRIFYRSARDQVEAEYIANEYFRKLDLAPVKLPAGQGVDRGVQVAIFLGNDYAALTS